MLWNKRRIYSPKTYFAFLLLVLLPVAPRSPPLGIAGPHLFLPPPNRPLCGRAKLRKTNADKEIATCPGPVTTTR